MNLTPRQKLTLEHLKKAGIKNNEQIIEWCLLKINQKRRQKYAKTNRRKRGKQYYRDILTFIKLEKGHPA